VLRTQVKLDFQRVKTHWNRGFTCILPGPHIWIVMLLPPVWPESGFLAHGTSVATVG
jgi:hypothetical protein